MLDGCVHRYSKDTKILGDCQVKNVLEFADEYYDQTLKLIRILRMLQIKSLQRSLLGG